MIRPGECIYIVEGSDSSLMRPCLMTHGKKCCYHGLKCQFEENIADMGRKDSGYGKRYPGSMGRG